MTRPREDSFLSQVGPILFLVGIFFINFLSRIILSPLMPTIESDLNMGHDEAGGLFFLITLGYCLGLLFSGFISSRLQHRKTIVLSSFAVGGATLFAGLTRHPWEIRSGLLMMGLAAGLYLPSGIATLTGLVHQRHWGKAIAMHELAPNLGFIMAPLLAEVFLKWFSWQGILTIIGIASLGIGLIFFLWGEGGDFPGQAPNLKTLMTVAKEPSFLLMMTFFSIGVGSAFGVYSMLPLYLVSEKGMDQTWANSLVALSRLSTLGTAFIAGWFTDRVGIQKTLKIVFLTTGFATAMLGIVPGSWIIPVVFIQPILATAFFPAGFAALAKTGPLHLKSLAVSITVPIGFFVGGGVVTAGLGLAGEGQLFPLGFVLLGGLVSAGAGLARYLRLTGE